MPKPNIGLSPTQKLGWFLIKEDRGRNDFFDKKLYVYGTNI
jgi:hypothetical protein